MFGLGALLTTFLASSVASTAIGVYSQIQQGAAAKAAAEHNNRLAQAEAANREAEAAEASRRERLNQRARMSAMRARLANSGTMTSTGSPLVILGETASRFETAMADAKRRTDMQASSLRMQGQMGQWNASQQQTASYIGAAATSLQGVANLGSSIMGHRHLGTLRTRSVS